MKMELRSRAIDKIFKRRDRYDIPEWQRDEVWSVDQERLLIDTILRGWHLPKFYLVKVSDSPEGWEVVDGQQRLAAIFSFLDGNLSLLPDTQAEFGGPFYKDLPSDISDRFDDFEIDYEEITEAEEGEVQEYFGRLQQGLPLTPAEKLNAIPGKLTLFVRNTSKHPFFRDKVVLKDTRYAYFDVASKVTAIEIQGLEAGLRFDDLEDLMSTNTKFSDSSPAGQRVIGTLEFLNSHVFSERSSLLRNRSMIQSIITLTSRLLQAGIKKTHGPRLRVFLENFQKELQTEVEKGHEATDKDLLDFQSTISANVKTGPGTRQMILLRRLCLSDKELADLVNPGSMSDVISGMNLAALVSEIEEFIYKLNKKHQAAHGEDLFKPTAETTHSLAEMKNAARDLSGYKDSIDSLYFLLWEGSGSGKRFGATPPVEVADVRDLRTQVRHDLNHGDQAAAKMKKIGQVFLKYASVSSPEALKKQAFGLVQARILMSVRDCLRSLAAAP